MGSLLPGTVRPASGSDAVPQLSPETSRAFGCSPRCAGRRGAPRAAERLSREPSRVRKLGRARTPPVALLQGFLGSPRAVQNFAASEKLSGREPRPLRVESQPGLYVLCARVS